MYTLKQMQALALSQVGAHESPDGSNRVLYSLWYGLIGAWCMMFAQWLLFLAGIKTAVRTASTMAFVKAARASGHFHEGVRGIVPGAFVFFHWPESSRAHNQPDHVEFVFSTTGGYPNDIGGNVHNGVARIRRVSNILGWWMPVYAPQPKPKPKPARKYPGHVIRKGDSGLDVLWIQKQLLRLGIKLPKYGADGDFGDETVAGIRQIKRKWRWPPLASIGPRAWKRLGL